MVKRFIVLFQFEWKKILARKKAILFLLVLNVLPILASIFGLLVFAKFKSFGIGSMNLSFLIGIVKGLFIAHIVTFAAVSPFFIALIIGDTFSGELGRGYMKTLLLTPVSRASILVAKTCAVMTFLILALALGGMFLQTDIWVARSMVDAPGMVMDVAAPDTTLVGFQVASRILILTFLANLSLVGFFILVSLFFESPILMAFASLLCVMGVTTFSLMAPFLQNFDPRYGTLGEWCFTRHLITMFNPTKLQGILDEKLFLSSPEISKPLLSNLGWAAFFFIAALFVFRRKQVLH